MLLTGTNSVKLKHYDYPVYETYLPVSTGKLQQSSALLLSQPPLTSPPPYSPLKNIEHALPKTIPYVVLRPFPMSCTSTPYVV